MNTTQNTVQNLTLSLPVGQLAKNPIYSLDSAPVLSLEVGRHTKLFSHTSTRTHEGEPAPDFNAEKLLSLPDLELKTYLIDLLSDQLPELDLCIHNKYYYFDILEKYSSIKSQLFELLLRLFALQNKTVKGHRRAKKITTTENNFLAVFQLLKDRKHRELSKNVKPHHKQQVLDIIEERKTSIKRRKYKFVYVTIEHISNNSFLTNQKIEQVIELLVFEGYLLKIYNQKEDFTCYKKNKKPFSHVA
jgi:hypothetical protein